MHTFFKALPRSWQLFAREEEGAQVIEYALIIAVVSLALIVALQQLTTSGGAFATFIGKVKTCLTTGVCV